jgi:hypothetical protein
MQLRGVTHAADADDVLVPMLTVDYFMSSLVEG